MSTTNNKIYELDTDRAKTPAERLRIGEIVACAVCPDAMPSAEWDAKARLLMGDALNGCWRVVIAGKEYSRHGSDYFTSYLRARDRAYVTVVVKSQRLIGLIEDAIAEAGGPRADQWSEWMQTPTCDDCGKRIPGLPTHDYMMRPIRRESVHCFDCDPNITPEYRAWFVARGLHIRNELAKAVAR